MLLNLIESRKLYEKTSTSHSALLKAPMPGTLNFTNQVVLYLSVKHLSGCMKLQFIRLPYTHWAISFIKDPVIDLGMLHSFYK